MEQVYLSCVSTHDEHNEIDIYLNISGREMEDSQGILVEFYIHYRGKLIYFNSRRFLTTAWIMVREAMKKEFIDDFFNKVYVEMFSKETITKQVDKFFSDYYKSNTDPLQHTIDDPYSYDTIH